MIVYDWIEISTTGLFTRTSEPGHGHLAALFPIIDRAGGPLDLVAWLPDHPHGWWTERGSEVVLGLPAIHHAEWTGKPLALYGTPDRWHRAKGEGACILDWKRPGEILDALCGVAHVRCETDALGQRLALALRDALKPKLRISIDREALAA